MDRSAVLGHCAASKRLIMLRAFGNLLVAAVLLLPQAALAGEFTDTQREEIGTIVREYLLQHPEVLVEVSQELERRQKLAEDEQRKNTIAENADEIFRSSADFVAGNPQGDVTMVEFFDYNCPWCKKSLPIIRSILEADGSSSSFKNSNSRRRFRIRGAGDNGFPGPGKYLEFHLALCGHANKIDAQAVGEIAQSGGIDLKNSRRHAIGRHRRAIDRISSSPRHSISERRLSRQDGDPGHCRRRWRPQSGSGDAGGCTVC
jgi:hypothetical protein